MKRITASALAALALFSASANVSVRAAAAEPSSVISVHSSDYLSSYNSFATKIAPGKMDVSFKVVAPLLASKIGVSKLEIYQESGTKMVTVYGSAANGLQSSNTSLYTGTYHFTGTPGTAYYAVVTVFASDEDGSDSRTIVTNSVTL